ncbi:MAG: hypothetical protein HQL84_11290 [Magnetococcales bacterium]|nr:hypothetical protein [Magnetococcales bacterium]MBF0150618.1 hypothetical protein [Magnetococcales bacterium]MBF0174544.1 hypothetical protein [Magnetococcales bacterium]MBF0348547.1 hypothetical protein [Magnetococcales bacterium]MBF0629366.1 hypothetical protein [Magnetococcales bacterium]
MRYRKIWPLFCFLAIMGGAGTGMGGQGLPCTIMKPEIKILPPVIDPDPAHQAMIQALETQFFEGSWILDEPVIQNNRIVHVREKETASIGQRLIIEGKDIFHVGDRLTVHRPGAVLHDSEHDRILGRLSETLGIIEIVGTDGHESTAVVIKAFKEMMAGDLVDSFLNEKIPLQIKIDPGFDVSGKVVHIEHDLDLAGIGQVVVVALGVQDRVHPGLVLPVYRSKPPWVLHESNEIPRQDPLPIAEVVFFRIAAHASLALITQSTEVVEMGDWVGARIVSPGLHENP